MALAALRRPPPSSRPSPIPPPRARGGDPIGELTQGKVETLLRELKHQLPFLPDRVSDDPHEDVAAHVFLKECFRGECFQYAICGLSDPQRSETIEPLQRALDKAGLSLSAVDSGSLILIHQASSNKGRALDQFAREVGLSPNEIYKFGDSAGPTGNDRELLRDDLSFNVGPEPAVSARAINVGDRGPDGVVDVLDWLEASGTFPKAIAADFDKTLNRGESSPEHEMDPRIARKLVQYAQHGAEIGIITGRGESFFDDGLPPLIRAGLDTQSAEQFHIYLFNGARPIHLEEWPDFWSHTHVADAA